ncbi:hypothetical protein [Methanobacterium arcticum]|uniref:hypothetical protein n=1 Tax=Methanobacterium arcticum TaxID=386456 RepID=UPI00146FE34C|nr:hypothetical protein [Methanobacterium arcticum]
MAVEHEALKIYDFGACKSSICGSGNRRFPSTSKLKILTVFGASKSNDFDSIRCPRKLCFLGPENHKFSKKRKITVL